MNFLKTPLNNLNTLKSALIAVASLLFLTPCAQGMEQMKEQATLVKVCPSPESLPKRSFDTAKYYVYICRGEKADSLGYYVRIPKTGFGNLTLPVSRRSGETYVAMNGEIVHTINPYEFVVVKKGRVILKERVNKAIDGDSQPLVRDCPEGQKVLIEAETTNFIVYICGGDVPRSYINIAKNGIGKITMPVQSYYFHGKLEDSRYVAVNGDILYVLTQKVLRVTQNGQTIVKEKVIKFRQPSDINSL
jgi:hypothetical protein